MHDWNGYVPFRNDLSYCFVKLAVPSRSERNWGFVEQPLQVIVLILE